jgi:hypothetical protein
MTRATKAGARRGRRPPTAEQAERARRERLRADRARRGGPERSQAERDGWAVGRGRTPGWFGMGLLLVMWLGICVMPVWFSLPDLSLASGRTGVSGTLHVVSCEKVGKGRYDCRGRFTPDDEADGPPVDVRASPDSDAGETYPAQLDPEAGRAVPNGFEGVMAVTGLMALGPLCAGFLPYCVLYVAGARRRALRGAVVFGAVLTGGSALFMVFAFTAAHA